MGERKLPAKLFWTDLSEKYVRGTPMQDLEWSLQPFLHMGERGSAQWCLFTLTDPTIDGAKELWSAVYDS